MAILSPHSLLDPLLAGDELFSDTYPMKLVDDCIWEVYGKVRGRGSMWRVSEVGARRSEAK